MKCMHVEKNREGELILTETGNLVPVKIIVDSGLRALGDVPLTMILL